MKITLFDLNIHDISPVQALIILNLNKDEINIKDFVRRGYYGGTNVTYNLNSLVENGYMISEAHPKDLRSRRIKLSKKGVHVFNKIFDVIEDQNKSIINSGIDEKESNCVNNSLKKIGKTIELFSYCG